MKKMKRREFLNLAVGMVLVPKISCQGEKENKSYNLVDDLTGEMNKFDREHPELEFQYFICCSYSGLGWLDKDGYLEIRDYMPDLAQKGLYVLYSHILHTSLDFKKYNNNREVQIEPDINEKVDIRLFRYCNWKDFRKSNSRIRKKVGHPCRMVTTRCSNINYIERGKKIMIERKKVLLPTRQYKPNPNKA